MYQHIKVPTLGEKITVATDGSLHVPDQPIIPYIEGDGTGMDITPVMLKVVDAAVTKAYNGTRKIHWMEIYAGEKATQVYGPDVWLPEETLEVVKDYVVSIKGPLTTPLAAAFARLMWRCGKSWICTCVCVRCVISAGCLHRCASPKKPTW